MTEAESFEDIKLHKYFPILLQAAIYIFSLLLFKIFCRFETRGAANVGKKGPVIFAPNHSSEWDGILTRVALPFFSALSPMYYVSMSKEEYTNSGWRKIFYGGKFFELLGAYQRYSGRRNYAFSLRNYLKILSLGGAVCIFPEGKRTESGVFGEAHGGVAFLAHRMGASVVPVGISGLANFTTKDLFSGKRKVIIRFGKPMAPLEIIKNPDPKVADYKKGATVVMNEVKKLVNNL